MFWWSYRNKENKFSLLVISHYHLNILSADQGVLFSSTYFCKISWGCEYISKIKCTKALGDDNSSNSNCSIHQAINKYSWLNLYFVKGHSVIELENLKQETDM